MLLQHPPRVVQEAVALCEAAGEEGKPLLPFALAGVASGAKVGRRLSKRRMRSASNSSKCTVSWVT